ncbi:MAG: conditioned medium factor [Acidobacteria bacterium]|nr:conditioned medium factor [Acidobacteriota bacterium]
MSKFKNRIFGGTLGVLLVFSMVAAAFGQKTKSSVSADFKNLAGGADEISMMRLPAPDSLGTRSKSAMFPIGGEAGFREFEIPVDSTENFKLMLLSPNAKALNLAAALPNGEFFDLRASGFARGVDFAETTYGLDGNQFPAEVYGFGAVKPGLLRVRIEIPAALAGAKNPVGYLVAASDSPFRLYSYLDTLQTTVGREIGISAVLFDTKTAPGTGRPEALAGTIHESTVVIRTPKGETLELPMNDAGDGRFRAAFVPRDGGSYTAQIFSRGITPEGNDFIRSAEQSFEVAPQTAVLGSTPRATPVDELRWRVELPVAGLETGRKVIVHAEVFGRDADGNEFPVSWLGGMALTETRSRRETIVALTLDSRWLAQAAPAKNYLLRNVRLQDPDSGVVLGQTDDLSVPNLRATDAAKSFTGVVTDEMRQGRQPVRISADAAGGKLMLVHGYCSGDAWGAAAQFTNYVKFLDLNKNRTHDQFANLIKSFGASLPSYGIVAHSQGGAAALHLYTYYWSGLDSATGARLIQSVGTPYQGTALAGNLAILGQIFGAGCGSNNDLTYSGAATWLANIPAWARAKVYYHTTSFTDVWYRYDYCNIATDPFLSDPDDGVVEKAYAQLSGANNLGHKTGWCHTSGMRDPAQTSDASRNSNMNSNAAR